jgi:hypothetical protein
MRLLLIAVALLAFAQPAPPLHRAYLPAVVTSPDAELVAIDAAVDGLLWPSETDAPPRAVALPEPTPAAACAALGGTVRPVNFDRFGPEWAALRALLLDPVACKVGGIEGVIYVLSASPRGGVVGIVARVVET